MVNEKPGMTAADRTDQKPINKSGEGIHSSPAAGTPPKSGWKSKMGFRAHSNRSDASKDSVRGL
jgi:hypothetical protein